MGAYVLKIEYTRAGTSVFVFIEVLMISEKGFRMGGTFPDHQPGVLAKIRPGTKTGTAPGTHGFKKLQTRNVLQVHRGQWHLSKPPKSVEITP